MTKRRRIRQAREQLARLAAPWIYEQAKRPLPLHEVVLNDLRAKGYRLRAARHPATWARY